MDVEKLVEDAREVGNFLGAVNGGETLLAMADALEALNRENKELTERLEPAEWEWGIRHSQGTNECHSRAHAEERYQNDVAYDHRRQRAYQGRTRLVKRIPAGPWIEVEVSS